ncbi:hypothetical protein HDU97_002041 [Phlyctochytrium planicorne]|nr:hypothetical protein HDU97_002041 [Phlyctochytrium planicorne]
MLVFYLTLMIFLVNLCQGAPQAPVKIKGTGASFPNDIYQKLIKQFMSTYSGGAINSFDYIPDSSTAGLNAVNTNETYQFGGADIGVNPALYNQSTLLALPAVAGAIAVAYNIPELSRLGTFQKSATFKISRIALPSIFDGTIQYWNDSRILGDNDADVQAALASIKEPIQLVVRSKGSGTSANFIRFLTMVKRDFVEWQNVPNLKFISAKTNQAVGQIVGSIPYTITYMDRDELEKSKTGNNQSEPPLAAYVQNSNLEYVYPSREALTIALQNLDIRSISEWNPYNKNILALDINTPGSYPISIVSNFIIRQNNISSDIDTTAWMLRYMWWTLSTKDAAAVFDLTNFVSLRNTSISQLSLSFLKNFTQPTSQSAIYSQSPCDLAAEGTNPCKHGRCPNKLPFQPPDVKCVCDPGYSNINLKDCSEETPVFATWDPLVVVQLILAGVSIGICTAIFALLIWHRKHPKLRAISPMCCYVIMVGCLCGAMAIVAYAATPSKLSCRIRIFFPATGFGTVFGMLLLKTYRIYTIFGYTRLKTSRGIRDSVLVYLTTGIACVEILLCILQVMVSDPRGKDSKEGDLEGPPASFSGNTEEDTSFVMCAPSIGKEGISVAIDIILYAYNAVVLLMALLLALKTRGAFKRFAESKAIGMVTYVVTICVSMGLPVMYAIPILSQKTNSVVNMVRCVLLFILSTGTPLVLFAKRLGEVVSRPNSRNRLRNNQTNDTGVKDIDKSSGVSFDNDSNDEEGGSEGTSLIEHAHLQSFMFDVGICRNRFGAAWSSGRLLMLPLHNIIFIVDSMHTAETIVSMRISTTLVTSPDWDDPDVSSIASPSALRVDGPGQQTTSTGGTTARRGNRTGSRVETPDIVEEASGLSQTDGDGSDNYQKRMVILIPDQDRAGWFVEFVNMSKLKMFKAVHRSVSEKEVSAADILGSIRKSLMGITDEDEEGNFQHRVSQPPPLPSPMLNDSMPLSVRDIIKMKASADVGSRNNIEGVLVMGRSALVLDGTEFSAGQNRSPESFKGYSSDRTAHVGGGSSAAPAPPSPAVVAPLYGKMHRRQTTESVSEATGFMGRSRKATGDEEGIPLEKFTDR